MFWTSLALSLVGIAGYFIGLGLLLTGSAIIAIVAFVVAFAASVAAFVVDVRFMYELSRCFGHVVAIIRKS